MNKNRITITCILLLATAAMVLGQSKLDLEGSLDFLKIPASSPISTPTGVAINSKGHIFVAHSGSMKLMEFAEDGTFIRALLPELLVGPHGVRVDNEDNIWVTDMELQMVFKINSKGQITLVLGQKNKSGLFDQERNMALLYRPADVAFGAKGEIYVADGYGNSRVVKFDKNGKFLKTWGEKGTEEGQFDNPHNIIVDAEERVYVADRNNERVQIFDKEGKFLKAWTHLGKPWGLALAKNQSIFLTDGTNEKIYQVNKEGEILGTYGVAGQQKGQFRAAHGIALDAENNIYITEVLNWRVQKLYWKK